MRKLFIKVLLGIVLATSARADTQFTIGADYSCFDVFTPFAGPPVLASIFNLNGIGTPGIFRSEVTGYYNYLPQKFNAYDYKIDLSGMPSAANHCVRLIIHFGNAINCANPVALNINPAVSGNPAQIQSATEAAFGDVTFVFAGGCLEPGQPQVNFRMVSGVPWKEGFVTIIDDYYDPAGGPTNEARLNVPALVPDIPPNWAYAPAPLPNVFFQGSLLTNGVPLPTNYFDFKVQLSASPSNNLPVSQAFTQTVQVANGLFNLPLPFDPIGMADGSARWLIIAVRPAGGSGGFTQLNTPFPINPTPQALHAYTAGTVADLTPGQAVTSLNGLTDTVNLQAGSGIILGTNGNALTISTQPGVPSDRGIKTDVAPISADKILASLAALPISSWRYTNETAGVRHVGPMAQDFRAAFGLGHGDKLIEFVDEQGVALTAIQGLNQKLNEKEAEIQQLRENLAELKQMISQSAKTKLPEKGDGKEK
jgi:hypothetical protein